MRDYFQISNVECLCILRALHIFIPVRRFTYINKKEKVLKSSVQIRYLVCRLLVPSNELEKGFEINNKLIFFLSVFHERKKKEEE
jgi:hypothetical protein